MSNSTVTVMLQLFYSNNRVTLQRHYNNYSNNDTNRPEWRESVVFKHQYLDINIITCVSK